MGCSLQKKIQELRENLGVTHCNPQYVLAQVSKELGVVAQKIRAIFDEYTGDSGYIYLTNEVKEKVLGLLVEGEKP